MGWLHSDVHANRVLNVSPATNFLLIGVAKIQLFPRFPYTLQRSHWWNHGHQDVNCNFRFRGNKSSGGKRLTSLLLALYLSNIVKTSQNQCSFNRTDMTNIEALAAPNNITMQSVTLINCFYYAVHHIMYCTGPVSCHGALCREDASISEQFVVEHSCSLMQLTRPEVSFGSMECLLKLCFFQRKPRWPSVRHVPPDRSPKPRADTLKMKYINAIQENLPLPQ